MKFFLILLTAFLLPIKAVNADANDIKKELISKYFELTQSDLTEIRRTVIQDRYEEIDQLKKNNPYMIELQVKIMKEEYKNILDDELSNEKTLEIIHQIYSSTYSIEELKKLVSLAQSPATSSVLLGLTAKGKFVRQDYFFNSAIGVKLYPLISKRMMSKLANDWALENKQNQ